MKKKILVVDDSITSKSNVERMLIELNVNHLVDLFYASNGFDGIIKTVQVKPDLILMDWHMDNLDGLEAIYILRTHNDFKYVPIIMLSGDGSVVDKSKGLLIGANEFISKGLDYETYFEIINQYLDLPNRM